jgi:spermidine synthase
MLIGIAFLGGFSVLVIEILGVHLLAPWFGNSTFIWSQQIAIILSAMAIGGWIGGNIAKKKSKLNQHLIAALVAAAVFCGVLAACLDLVAAAMLPADLSLEQAASVFQLGSFLTAVLFFAPPVFFLSWLTPILVEIGVEKGANAGQTAGRIAAIGTVGSLLGIIFSTYLALPFIGVKLSITIISLLLIGCALMLRRDLKIASLAAVLLLPTTLEDNSHTANIPSGAVVLEAVDSPYQRLRVIEFEDKERWLQMNEGLDSYQSKWLPDQQWPGGYYDLFALLPIYFDFQSQRQEAAKYFFVGYGAGSGLLPIDMAHQNTDWLATGVELDPKVVELTQKLMPLSKEVLNKVDVVSNLDGRAALRMAEPQQDAIVVDAYSRQFEIPLHLATQEFYSEIYSKLRDGGVLCFNLGTTVSDLDDSTLAAVGGGIVKVFGYQNVRFQHVARSRNWVLFARKNAPLPSLSSIADLLPEGWPIEVGTACLPAECIEGEQLADLGKWALSDDLNPLLAKQLSEW